ncbi:hypothetical protein D9M69_256020 [compost metagenome]
MNGIVSQIGLRHPEFADLHPHCLRSTCATDFKETGRRRGLDESDIDKDMQAFFGWRSDQLIAPYVEDVTRPGSRRDRIGTSSGVAFRQCKLSERNHDERRVKPSVGS